MRVSVKLGARSLLWLLSDMFPSLLISCWFRFRRSCQLCVGGFPMAENYFLVAVHDVVAHPDTSHGSRNGRINPHAVGAWPHVPTSRALGGGLYGAAVQDLDDVQVLEGVSEVHCTVLPCERRDV